MAFSGYPPADLMSLERLTNRLSPTNQWAFHCKKSCCEQVCRGSNPPARSALATKKPLGPTPRRIGPIATAPLPPSGFLIAVTDQIAVHRVLGHLPPEILVGAIGDEAIEQLLEPFVLARQLRVKLAGRLVAA